MKNKDFTEFDDIDELIKSEFDSLIDLSKIDTSVKTWIDSGVYALNYSCSKNLFGAYPVGRVSSIDGLTGTGKSLLVASAMKDPQVDYIIIFETEGGGNSQELLEFAGVDLKKIRVFKTNTFENYKIKKSNSVIEAVNDNKFPKKKEDEKFIYKEGATRLVRRFLNLIEFNKINKNILMILDSIGNLSSVREFSGTPDMGAKPKAIAEFFRNFNIAFESSDVAFIFTNKLYTNIGNPWDPFRPSGGVNVEYNPSLSIRLTNTTETDDISEKDMKSEKERRQSALGSSLKTVRAKIQKSRFGTEMRQIPFLIDFSTGPVKYSGLFTLCRDFDVIEKSSSSRYKINGMFDNKTFFKKDFINMVIADEENNLKKLQERLAKREAEIKKEKAELQVNDLSDNDKEIIDEITKEGEISEEDFSDMKRVMVRDAEK